MDMHDASRVRVSGPLTGWAQGLIDWLTVTGFGRQSQIMHTRRLALLSRWLERDGVDPVVVDEELIGALLADHQRRVGSYRSLTGRSFRPVLEYLRAEGVVPPEATWSAPVDVLLDRFRDHLAVERGLQPSTITKYAGTARLFLLVTCRDNLCRLGALSAGDVARFVAGIAEGRRASSVNTIVVGVRALLRYLYAAGLIATPLAQATPWLAQGQMSSLPRLVPLGSGELLLAGLDRRTLVGARDFAIVTVLARLGLRAGELVAMELDDIDWRRGELLVRSKGGWRDSLPLPVDVGEALAVYLSARGRDDHWRQVFLRVLPPLGPMVPGAVNAVIRRRCARVGLPDLGTHRLRHSVAGDLLRAGAALPEIGQVLRHHELATTAIYARVDHSALAALAQPWPGSGS
jgi:site-specific recombinase XerD